MTKKIFRRGFLAVSSVAALALLAQTSVVSNASWNDAEWSHSPVGVSDCDAADGAFASQGLGRALSGSLLGINLDTLAEAKGVTTTNNGARTKVDPVDALPAPADPAFADPLDVTALSAVNINLGQGLLQLPLDNSTGVLGQYAKADTAGNPVAASGYITESGAIATDTGAGYPNLATLDLKTLLEAVNPTVATTVAALTGLSLEVGAVSGRAQLNGCDTVWGQDLANTLDRDYLVAGADLVIDSPTVAALVGAVTDTVTGLQNAVDGLTYQVLKPLLEQGITGLLSGLLGALSLGSVNVSSAVVDIDLSAVNNLLTTTITDSGGVVTIDLDSELIRVNTAALLAETYPGQYSNGLNGLLPNTDLLADPAILNTLTAATTSALTDWIVSVNTAIDTAVGAITVDIKADVILEAVVLPVAKILLEVTGPLDSLAVVADTKILGVIDLGILGGITSALVSGLGGVVKGIILGTNGIVRKLPATVTALTTPIVNTVTNLYSDLFVSGVLQLLVNAQNDPLSGYAPPPDWLAISAGQFHVAGLRVGVLGALGNSDVRLYLGRAAVGHVCSVASANNDASSPCASY